MTLFPNVGPTRRARVRRSVLFIPGDRIDRIEKGINMSSDSVVIDLEDAVSRSRKEEARRMAKTALEQFDFGNKEVIVRVNPYGTVNSLKDLLMLYECERKPSAIMLPKVESAWEVTSCSGILDELDEKIELLVVLESGKGILRASDIAMASPRISGVVFGGGDLSGELGCSMEWGNLITARQITLFAAACAKSEALDVPFLDIKDVGGLLDECHRAAAMGFAGKIAIHPSQIEPINRAFSPSPDAVSWANKIVNTADETSVGVFAVDGKMVDEAVIRRARRIMALADWLAFQKGRGSTDETL